MYIIVFILEDVVKEDSFGAVLIGGFESGMYLYKVSKRLAMWRHKNEGMKWEKWERKPLKKEIGNPSFLWRHMADFLDTL